MCAGPRVSCPLLPCLRAAGADAKVRARFEKSLYDLIRGLRNHKGNEREYIQSCLKECRSEIRSQDMGPSAATLPGSLPS